MTGLDAIANPIGKLAPKTGIGQIFDPAGAVGRKVGGTAGKLIDPAQLLAEPEPVEPRARSVATGPGAALLSSRDIKDSKKLGGR